MNDVVIVGALRTAVGSFNGAFKNMSAIDLGVHTVKAVLKQANVKEQDVDELIFGNVLQAGLGQNVARQVAIGAGLPIDMPSFTVNKVCGSGLKSVMLAVQAIRAGDAQVVVAGGTENMSQSPYVMPDLRWGGRMGNSEAIDTMVHDGLTDAFSKVHMGITAENIAEKYNFTRKQQDEFAVTSQNRAEQAQKAGRFQDEIIAVEIPQRKGEPIVVDKDEYIRHGATIEQMEKLRPAFQKDGTVTAANASGLNDGAACVLVMSAEKAQQLGCEILATIKSYASAGVDPQIMGTGPIPATRLALQKAGLTVKDLDLIEANEAFAAQALSVVQELELDPQKVNVNGGAIALGHPIGASGTRILVTLLHEMKKRQSKTGLATLCIGGGQGVSLIVER